MTLWTGGLITVLAFLKLGSECVKRVLFCVHAQQQKWNVYSVILKVQCVEFSIIYYNIQISV